VPMRVMFTLYLVVIATGLVLYTFVGLRHL
jgi:hypothetical protein